MPSAHASFSNVARDLRRSFGSASRPPDRTVIMWQCALLANGAIFLGGKCMRKMSIGLAMMMFVAVTAVGQLTAPYAGWGDTAAKWLMTKDEAKQWKAIRNDADAKKFVDLFWARRDPTPATARNEFKEEFDLRVGLADQSFTTAKTKGSLSDRGRAVILLGSPYTVTSKGGGGRVAGNPINTPGASADGSVSVGAVRGAGPM